MKTQPWITAANGNQMRFGRMYRSDLQTVHQEAPVWMHSYPSIE